MRLFTALVSLLFLLGSCKQESFNINNLNNNKIVVLGHGGMGSGQTYPMNSFESIAKCLAIGAHGSEMDIQLTKDSVLVVFHDKDLSSITNLSGMVNELNWSEIKHAHYTETPYLNYPIISLNELLENTAHLQDFQFTFDCKLISEISENKYHKTYATALLDIIQKYQLEKNVYIESRNTNFLSLLQSENKDLQLFIYPNNFRDGLEIASNMELFGITISTKLITKEQVEEAHENNIRVAIWNTHTKNRNIEAVQKSPDFIQTDKVNFLINLLN
jgi:glycerophosphoryl diester phosphodiesterase